MATSKMEKIEKLKDERMRSSLVRCQAELHVSKKYICTITSTYIAR